MASDKFNFKNGWVRRNQMATVTNQHNAVVDALRAEIERERFKLSQMVSKVTTRNGQGTVNHILSIVAVEDSIPIYEWVPLTSLILRDTTTDPTSSNMGSLWKLTMSDTTDADHQLVLTEFIADQ